MVEGGGAAHASGTQTHTGPGTGSERRSRSRILRRQCSTGWRGNETTRRIRPRCIVCCCRSTRRLRTCCRSSKLQPSAAAAAGLAAESAAGSAAGSARAGNSLCMTRAPGVRDYRNTGRNSCRSAQWRCSTGHWSTRWHWGHRRGLGSQTYRNDNIRSCCSTCPHGSHCPHRIVGS